MKKLSKIAILVTLLSVVFLFSCKEKIELAKLEPSNLEMKFVMFKGLEAAMPNDFPEGLIDYGSDDLEKVVFGNEISKSSRAGEKKTLDEVIEKVLAKYPSFDTFDAKAYKKYFPKMSVAEIIEKSDTVLQYMETLIGYDIADTFAKEGNGILKLKSPTSKNGRVTSTSLEWNDYCQAIYLIGHARMHITGLWESKRLAYYYQAKYYGTQVGGNDDADALRHGVWGIFLGKYACYRYPTVSEAASVAAGFLAAHECNADDTEGSSSMDKHNNGIAIAYYMNNAERYQVNWLNYNTRVNKTDDQIGADINNVEIRLVNVNTMYGAPSSVLVKLK